MSGEAGRKNAPQFDGDPIEVLLDEKGRLRFTRLFLAAVVTGVIPVGVLIGALIWVPDLLGPAAPVLALPFLWMSAWFVAADFTNSLHDVDFRRARVDKSK